MQIPDDAGPAAHSDERWAAEQVVRQHESSRCKQCTHAACELLAWAQAVLGDGPVTYPRVAPAQPLLTG